MKVKLKDVMPLQSQGISALFVDTSRSFPTKTAFKFARLLKEVAVEMETYHEQVKLAIEKNGGDIANDGKVTYPDDTHQEAAGKEILDLQDVEIELKFEQVEMTDKWPALTVAEAQALEPFIK